MAMFYLELEHRRRAFVSSERWDVLEPMVIDAVMDVALQFEAWVKMEVSADSRSCEVSFSPQVPDTVHAEVERDLQRLCEIRLTRRLSEDMFDNNDVRLRYMEDTLLDSLLTLLL